MNLVTFESLITGISHEESNWKPPQDQWSVVEIVNHLADEEVEDFRTRLDLTLHFSETKWPPIDPEQWVIDRNYQERDLKQSFARFAQERSNSLTWLRFLKSPAWEAVHTDPELGSMSAGSLLASWLAHDYLHIRQIVKVLYLYQKTKSAPNSIDYAGRL